MHAAFVISLFNEIRQARRQLVECLATRDIDLFHLQRLHEALRLRIIVRLCLRTHRANQPKFFQCIAIQRTGILAPSTARPLKSFRALTCASPAYLKKNGSPKLPADLMHHECLGYAHGSGKSISEWQFQVNGDIV